jgi:autotransporter-associated beta strand protein
MNPQLGVDSRIFVNTGATIAISTGISDGGAGRGITSYGAGTVVLSGANTHSGGTVVEEGTLRVANSSGSATGSGPVTVASGATLSGTGTIVPNTGTPANNTVAVSGTVKPGTDTTTGYLTVGSDSTAAAVSVNGKYSWSLSNAGTSSTTPGGSDTNSPNDQSRLVVNGSLNFSPTSIDVNWLSGSAFDNAQPYSWRVATATGGVTVTGQPTFNAVGLSTGSGSFYLSSGVNGVFVNFSPVPEPAEILVVSAAATGVIAIIRNRRFQRWRDLGRRSR